MARNFTVNTNRLANASFTAPPAIGSIFIRCKPTWAHNDGVTHVLWWWNNSNGSSLAMMKFSDNNFYIGWLAAGVGDHRIVVAASAAMFTSGIWNTHLFTWDDTANESRYYADNVQLGTQLTTLSIVAMSHGLTLGNAYSGVGNNLLSAELAEFAIWNRVLTADERFNLNGSGCPLWIPSGLISYHSLKGDESPEIDKIGGFDLTVTGTAQATHPRILNPNSRVD